MPPRNCPAPRLDPLHVNLFTSDTSKKIMANFQVICTFPHDRDFAFWVIYFLVMLVLFLIPQSQTYVRSKSLTELRRLAVLKFYGTYI
jgi:hypothetical protein